MGPYAWHLKQRILSDKGHLSNDDGALAMCEMMGDRTKRIYLGHLSQDNNMKEIAYQTAESIFQTHDKRAFIRRSSSIIRIRMNPQNYYRLKI